MYKLYPTIMAIVLAGCHPHDEHGTVNVITFHDSPDNGQLIMNCAERDDGCTHSCFFHVDEYGEAAQEGDSIEFNLSPGPHYVYVKTRLWCPSSPEVVKEYSDTVIIDSNTPEEWTF